MQLSKNKPKFVFSAPKVEKQQPPYQNPTQPTALKERAVLAYGKKFSGGAIGLQNG